jgi:hypothetical protein
MKPITTSAARATWALRSLLLFVACSGDDPTATDTATAQSKPKPGATVEPRPSPTECLNAPDGTPDVLVSISALRGPRGAKAPVLHDRRIFAMSIADWEAQDYTPSPDPTYLAFLRALTPGMLRWPAGHRSQSYSWRHNGIDLPGEWTLTPEGIDAFIQLARAAGAEPLLALNLKRGTVEAAADIVRYVNVERRYGVHWFQLGNEPEIDPDHTLKDEAGTINTYANAIRQVDPSVRVVAPELFRAAFHTDEADNGFTTILSRMEERVDAVSWHYFPLDSNQRDPGSSARLSIKNLLQETAEDWPPAALSYVDAILPVLGEIRTHLAPQAEVWITELGEDAGQAAGAGVSDTIGGALWVGDAFGRIAEFGTSAIFRWLFKGSPEHVYGLLDPNNAPRPTYGAYWLYARAFGDRWVDATSSALTLVSAHAALRRDGAMTVMLANKTSAPCRVRTKIDGFTARDAGSFTLSGGGIASTSFTINGQPLTTKTASDGVASIPAQSEKLLDTTMPNATLRVLVYRP